MKRVGLIECSKCGGSGTVPDPAYHGAEARKCRLAAKVSLRTLATRMDLSVGYLSDLELGRRGWNEALSKRYAEALRG